MPAILDRLVKQLIANGMSKEKAWAVATKKMQEAGNIDKHGNATEKGRKRGKMTPRERAIDRRVKERGGSKEDYVYNERNNTAVKGKINKRVKKRA